MKKALCFICTFISNIAFADNLSFSFFDIKYVLIWRVLGLIGITAGVIGMALNSTKTIALGVAITIISASMLLNDHILTYIGFAVSFLIILSIRGFK